MYISIKIINIINKNKYIDVPLYSLFINKQLLSYYLIDNITN